MFFFIAEGYYQTKNLSKYLLRLFIFAMISWIPFSLFSQNRIISPYFGIILTMFLGLYALFICKSDRNILTKVLAVFGLCFLSIFGDWQVFGVLYILAFGLNRQNFKKQVLWFCVVTLMMILTMNVDVFFNPSFNIWSNSFLVGVFLPLPLMYFYNGKRGGEKHKCFNKWFFYVFYPAHLLIIWAIGLVLS